MTLVSSILADGYRECNMLALGKDPNDAQRTEALRLYNAVVTALYGGDAGERLSDWPLGNYGREASAHALHYTSEQLQRPPSNVRLLALQGAATTVYLTPRPQDGERIGIADPYGRLETLPITLNGNGRAIEGAPTITLNTDGLSREWIYRADLAAWLRISALEATDENPFPPEFDNMFVILTAMRLNPRYGRTLDDQSIAILRENKRQFVNRYLQSAPLETVGDISWPFMSLQSYGTPASFSSTDAFNRGNDRRI